jgi:hypothetical protein
MLIAKVISGGQTGADIAGLRAAKIHGIATGGYMTKGCRTQSGLKPEYLSEYGMEELPYAAYKPRTLANVFAADVTIRFAEHWSSPGEICTINAIKRYNKPYIDIPVSEFDSKPHITPLELAYWLIDGKYKIVNIAGNSERTSPGIEEWVEIFLSRSFRYLVAGVT